MKEKKKEILKKSVKSTSAFDKTFTTSTKKNCSLVIRQLYS